MKLNTKRLLLRPIKLEDKYDIFAYRSDKGANKYQGWIPRNINNVEEFIDKLAPEFDTPESWFQLAIIAKETQLLIGDIGIHFLEQGTQQIELGYTLNKKFLGNGFAYEAVKAVIAFLFTELKKHRITASIDPKNTPSFKLLEKLNFRKEAHFKESLFVNGQWVDDVVYAVLAREWE